VGAYLWSPIPEYDAHEVGGGWWSIELLVLFDDAGNEKVR
jgi:hypothetical protein